MSEPCDCGYLRDNPAKACVEMVCSRHGNVIAWWTWEMMLYGDGCTVSGKKAKVCFP